MQDVNVPTQCSISRSSVICPCIRREMKRSLRQAMSCGPEPPCNSFISPSNDFSSYNSGNWADDGSMSSGMFALETETTVRAGEFDLFATLEGTMREIKPFRVGAVTRGRRSTIVVVVLAGTTWIWCNDGRTTGAPTFSHAVYSALMTLG